jgi:hypothetical protein
VTLDVALGENAMSKQRQGEAEAVNDGFDFINTVVKTVTGDAAEAARAGVDKRERALVRIGKRAIAVVTLPSPVKPGESAALPTRSGKSLTATKRGKTPATIVVVVQDEDGSLSLWGRGEYTKYSLTHTSANKPLALKYGSLDWLSASKGRCAICGGTCGYLK